jgi:ribonuclease T2
MKKIAVIPALMSLLAACTPIDGDDGATPVAAGGTGFDFYVLSLAWSPTYCETEGAQANRQQCGAGRDLAFIVHGLWPQFERGWPEFCPSDEPQRVPDALVATALDIMPSAGLIGHQWRKHGACTGLSQEDYLHATREAFGRVAVPAAFTSARTAGEAQPDRVEDAFIEANPGLEPDGIAVTCSDGRLGEVRICLTKELAFRSCPEVDAPP